MPSQRPDHRAARDAVLHAAYAVGLVYERRDYSVSEKSDDTPLTTADLLANDICRYRLSRLLPEAGWLSEETDDDPSRLACDHVWIVDPIDGTREFVDRLDQFAVSAGLSELGRPVLGAVALPPENRIFHGAEGAGVFETRYRVLADGESAASGASELPLDFQGIEYDAKTARFRSLLPDTVRLELHERRIPASELRPLDQARILVSRSEQRKGRFDAMKERFHLDASGSIARKLALVAAGEGDLSLSLYPKSEWDICGGAALILAHPENAMLELDGMAPFVFNSPKTRGVGLAAGRRELVEEFRRFFTENGMELTRSYKE